MGSRLWALQGSLKVCFEASGFAYMVGAYHSGSCQGRRFRVLCPVSRVCSRFGNAGLELSITDSSLSGS